MTKCNSSNAVFTCFCWRKRHSAPHSGSRPLAALRHAVVAMVTAGLKKMADYQRRALALAVNIIYLRWRKAGGALYSFILCCIILSLCGNQQQYVWLPQKINIWFVPPLKTESWEALCFVRSRLGVGCPDSWDRGVGRSVRVSWPSKWRFFRDSLQTESYEKNKKKQQDGWTRDQGNPQMWEFSLIKITIITVLS